MQFAFLVIAASLPQNIMKNIDVKKNCYLSIYSQKILKAA